MERRKALVAAASASLVLATGAAAIAANVSLLGDDDGDVGQLDADTVTNLVPDVEATTTSTLPDGREVVVIDEWVTDPGVPVPPGGTRGSEDDDSDDDSDEYDDEHQDDDEHEDDEYQDEHEDDEHEDDD